MLSPVKIVSASSLGVILGAAMVIAQPFHQQSTVLGAAGHVEPVWVTGTIGFAETCSGPETTMDGNVQRDRNFLCAPQSWTATDERISGSVVAMWNADGYELPGHDPLSVTASTFEMTNAAGGWRCRSDDYLAEGIGSMTTGVETVTCVGAGDHDGLTAILHLDWSADPATYEGIVFAGQAPPVPDPASSE